MVLGLALTLAALALVAWHVELSPVLAALSRARPALLGIALALALVSNTVASAEVLHHTLAALGVVVPRTAVLSATLENLSFQAALPFGAGHASRAFSLVRGQGIDLKRGALSVPLLVGLKLAALGLLALVAFSERHPIAVAVSGILLGAGFTLVRRRYALHASALLRAFVAALVVTACQLAIFAVVASALGASLPFFAILLRFPLCLVLAKLPVTWMGFGTREAAVVALFQGHADPGTLAAAALLFGTVDQIVPGLLGLVFAPRFARHVTDR